MVRVNGLTEGCYLRPIVYLGYGEMGLNPLPCPVNVAIAAWPWGTYLGDEGVANGVSVQDQLVAAPRPQRRPHGGQGHRMYVNSSLAKVEALKAGYDEAILLAPDGQVRECTGENIFIVRDGVLVTPPTSDAGRPGRHHPGLGRDHRRRPGLRGAVTRPSSAPTSTRPTRRS